VSEKLPQVFFFGVFMNLPRSYVYETYI